MAGFLAALLSSTLLLRATAHGCSDGRRVRCIDVITKPDSPSTYGQGKGARGSAHCTPSGEKVFCLANHNYHRCSGDQLPCCRDGSNPRHGHMGGLPSSADAALVCGATDPPELTTTQDALLAKINQLSGPPAENSMLMKGSLILSVSLNSQASTTSTDISQILKTDESAAVRVGLASHLEVTLSSVNIICLKRMASRRLLDVLDGPQGFKISFSAEMPKGRVEKSHNRPLAEDVREALEAAKSGLSVESASLEWNTADATDTGGASCSYVYIILGVCGASIVMGGLVTVYLCRRWRKTAHPEPTPTEAAEVKLGKGEAVAQDKDEEASNAPSTQEPSEADEDRSIGSEVEQPVPKEIELKK